jgi:alkylhydroperoxidase/carboxymuconolactone decarboxylase family protein YurZ
VPQHIPARGETVADLKSLMGIGRETRRKVFGEDNEQSWEQMNDDFDPIFDEIMLGFRWGLITSRPGLDLRTRQLCAFATFLTVGQYEEVFIDRQIRGALRCGATPQEVVEVVLQTGLFAGLYKTAIRKRLLRIFKEMGYRYGVDWGLADPGRTTSDLKALMPRGADTRMKHLGRDEGRWDEWARMNDEFDPLFHELMLGLRWGTITARPGLDPRTRQLCTFATFLTVGEYDEVHIDHHISASLRCGATPQEIVEVILQTGLFAGLYKWNVRARAVAIFKRMGYRQGVDWGSPALAEPAASGSTPPHTS